MRKRIKTVSLNIRTTEQLRQQAREQAERQGKTLTEYIEQLVRADQESDQVSK